MILVQGSNSESFQSNFLLQLSKPLIETLIEESKPVVTEADEFGYLKKINTMTTYRKFPAMVTLI